MKNTQNTQNPNKTTAKDLDLTAIAGIKKYLSSVTLLTLGGTDYSATSLMAALQTEVDAITALDGGKAQLKQQVANTRKVRLQTRALRTLLRKYILTTYGAEALQMLGDFGMTPPKTLGPRTAEAKAEAQAKARTTREAKKNALKSALNPPATQVAASVSTTPRPAAQ